jgi:hypothetical protein
MDKVSAMFSWLVNNGYPTNNDTLELAKVMAEAEEEIILDEDEAAVD